jgi:sugar phosphate isomerase/epimerase
MLFTFYLLHLYPAFKVFKMTQLGIGTYAFAWAIGVANYDRPQQPMDAIAFVRRCAKLGVRLVQIGDNIPLHSLSDTELDKLQSTVHDLDIAVEIGTRGIAPEHLRRYLQIAQRFSSPILRIVVDTADQHPAVPDIIYTLQSIMPEFEAAGITLAVENHDRFKAATLAEIIEAVQSPNIGICLDTVNSFGALEGPDVVIETLGRYVVNLHVKDFTIARLSHNMGFSLTGTPAGQGMLDVLLLLKRLHDFGRDFNAILEVWTPFTGEVEATIANEATWVAASIDYLRKMIPI